MAEQIYNVNCGFFDAVNNDRVYTAEDMNRLYKRVIHDGVFPDENNNPSNDFLVEADSGMTIAVGTGEGVFASHWLKNSVDIPIDVPPNSSNDRIDSVIIQVDTRKSGRAGNIVYRTGEPSINPAPPEINEVQGVVEYRLANVSVVSGATAITNADITDLRGTSECPWVTGIVSADDIPPNSVTEAKLATDAVTSQKIHSGAVIVGKLGVGAVQTGNIDGGAVTSDKIGNGEVKPINIDNRAVGSQKIAIQGVETENIRTGAVDTLRLSDDAVTSEKIGDGEVKTNNIDDGSVTYDKLASDALAYIDGKLPFIQIVQNVGGVAAPIDITYLNSLTFDRKTFYYVWFAVDVLFTGAPREWCAFLELESDCQIVLRPNGDMYYRQYSNAQWSDFINKASENASAYSMRKLNTTIGFLADGCVAQIIRAQTSTFYGGYGADIKQIYINDSITFIDDDLLTTATSLNRLWIDNIQGAVEFGTELQTKITNGDINVSYRGSFNINNILVASQKKLNDRITALENA